MASVLPRTPPPQRQGQGSHCHICRKLIVWPGLCYTCATGKPRLIVRRDEREAESDAYPGATDSKPTS
jgi:hypothetical protein